MCSTPRTTPERERESAHSTTVIVVPLEVLPLEALIKRKWLHIAAQSNYNENVTKEF